MRAGIADPTVLVTDRDRFRSPADSVEKRPRLHELVTICMAPSELVTSTVIIPAYTLDRWGLLKDAVTSVQSQNRKPIELILGIDHNDELLERCRLEWGADRSGDDFPIYIVRNRFDQDGSDADRHAQAHGSKRRFGAGWARNSAAEIASGDVLAFLDDDASADPDWLQYLLAPYDEMEAIAVGGAPLPRYETDRPSWFPPNFDWVFGCAYEGLPSRLGPLAHLIGANMSVRSDIFREVGGFHSIDFDDLDLCMRVAALYPHRDLLYEPKAIVHHYVPAERVTWRYFWRRCFFVNREKVGAFSEMGDAANIRAERAFVRRAMTEQTSAQLHEVMKGNWWGIGRLAAMLVGLSMAACGHLAGKLRHAAESHQS
jgi:glucosyl-dolichyl phosphate glucuronosyltransferase